MWPHFPWLDALRAEAEEGLLRAGLTEVVDRLHTDIHRFSRQPSSCQSNRSHTLRELVGNLTTKVTLIFQQSRNDLSTIPSIKLVLNGLGNYEQVVKFNEVAAAR